MKLHEKFFIEAANEASKATCLKAKCGAIVVLKGKIIGRGFNSPAGGDENHRTCLKTYPIELDKPKSDRTCCVHAEWRAIMDAIKTHRSLEKGILYFTRVDEAGNIIKSGEPYCTVCSRLALDSGLSSFALWHDIGITIYNTDEFNALSYEFHCNKELIVLT